MAERKKPFAVCLFLTALTQLAHSGELTQLVRIVRACLLIVGVARHRCHGDLLRVVDNKGGAH